MTNLLLSQLELSGETATLYLTGALGASDVATLCDECAALPPAIRTLRLDLHSVTRDGGEAMDAVRALLRHWRTSRQGNFRLSFRTPNLFATLSESDTPFRSEAMTAMYL